jgi:hypothetical protein
LLPDARGDKGLPVMIAAVAMFTSYAGVRSYYASKS